MRILVVDDEAAARRRLALMLEELDEEVVGEAGDGVEALEMVRERAPDLLLLDIHMPEVDGFDVARHLPEGGPLVIFQTAYEEHALRAFEHEAVDYVLKPVGLDRLRDALDRARRRRARSETKRLSTAELRRLQEAMRPAGSARRRLLVRQGRGYRLVPFDEILRFSTSEGVTRAHTSERDHLVDHTMTELEERTAGTHVRTNRSELVHREHVVRIVPDAGGGGATVTLSDGTEVRVSRRRKSGVLDALEG